MSDLESSSGNRVGNFVRTQPRGWLIAAAIQAALVAGIFLLDDDFHDRLVPVFLLVVLDVVVLLILALAFRRGIPPVLAVLGGTLLAGYPDTREVRRQSQDKAVATYPIMVGVEQFFSEHPERVFASYDDIVGPKRSVWVISPVTNEVYTALFPVRRDWDMLPVTMDDGRKVIVLSDDAFHAARVSPEGEITGPPDRVKAYRAVLARVHRDGKELSPATNHYYVDPIPNDNGRFETTWRNGVREGPFRAYYANGALWAEANYINGRPIGRHVVYDLTGTVVFETTFAPHPASPPR